MLPLLARCGKITVSISRLCFGVIVLIPAATEALQAAATSMVKYVLEVH